MITLVLGGNKSGKSAFALDLVLKDSKDPCLIVTGQAKDAQFQKQILDHKLTRPAELAVHEVAIDLCSKLQQLNQCSALLIDCVDFWLFSVMHNNILDRELNNFKEILHTWSGKDLVLVTTELGLSPYPSEKENVTFVQTLGQLNQYMATKADRVFFLVAGIPQQLK